MRYLILPEIIYAILLYGSMIVLVASGIMLIRGIVKKCVKNYFLMWGVILLISLALIALTTTGKIVANTMIGG